MSNYWKLPMNATNSPIIASAPKPTWLFYSGLICLLANASNAIAEGNGVLSLTPFTKLERFWKSDATGYISTPPTEMRPRPVDKSEFGSICRVRLIISYVDGYDIRGYSERYTPNFMWEGSDVITENDTFRSSGPDACGAYPQEQLISALFSPSNKSRYVLFTNTWSPPSGLPSSPLDISRPYNAVGYVSLCNQETYGLSGAAVYCAESQKFLLNGMNLPTSCDVAFNDYTLDLGNISMNGQSYSSTRGQITCNSPSSVSISIVNPENSTFLSGSTTHFQLPFSASLSSEGVNNARAITGIAGITPLLFDLQASVDASRSSPKPDDYEGNVIINVIIP